MDSGQLHRPTHHYEEDYPPHLHSVNEGEHDHHGEKKSVLKKVKDKAKKLKDTIKHHGHHHEHDRDFDDDDEEDDDESLEDPEVHGAPMYDTTVIKGTNLPMQVDSNLEKPTDPREDRFEGSHTHAYSEPRVALAHEVNRPAHHDHVAVQQPPLAQIRETMPLDSRIETTAPMGAGLGHLQRDPQTMPLYSRTETTTPIGTGLGHLQRDPQLDSRTGTTAPIGTGLGHLQRDPQLDSRTGTTAPIGAGLGHLQKDPHAPTSRHDHVPISNYQTKVNDPMGLGGQEATVDPLIHKLENLDVSNRSDESKSNLPHDRMQYTGSHDQFAPQTTPTMDQFKQSTDTTSGHNDSIPKVVDPASPDMSMAPQDTITGKITSATSAITDKAASATSAITDKAISAKNVVASKLGYGPQEGIAASESSKKPVTETATEYAHTIADKLAPVYDKVVGAGTAVMAKVQGSDRSEHDTGVNTGGSNIGSHHTGGSNIGTHHTVPDKGVSVKDYLAEKFRPGDEDKALSEVISDAFQTKKDRAVEEPHKPVLGKVTESIEVRERLGTGKESRREGEDARAAGNEVVGRAEGVVDKLKDAVTSWLGKSTGIETAVESAGNSYVSSTGQAGQGERTGRDHKQSGPGKL